MYYFNQVIITYNEKEYVYECEVKKKQSHYTGYWFYHIKKNTMKQQWKHKSQVTRQIIDSTRQWLIPVTYVNKT